MKKLGLVFLFTACLPQGLVTDPKAVENDTTGGTSDSIVTTSPQIELTKNGTQFLKTIFGNKSLSSSQPIVGFGNGNVGESFCFSNENETNKNTFDSLVNCRRPLESEDLPAGEDDLLQLLTQVEPERDNARGLAFITQALQFYFSNTETAPTDKYYSQINTQTLKLSIKTAPIVFNPSSGEFSWDSTKQESYVYAGGSNPCSLSNQNTVGFDIGNDSSLGTSSERKKYFLTGLWVFERGETKPYETATVSPIGEYQGASSGPAQLFSTRANIFGSLLIPQQDENTQELGFLYFPGANSTPTNAPSTSPSPYKYTFGLYRQSFVPANQGTEISTANESTRNDDILVNGALITPVMGKYNASGNLVTDSNANGASWEKRVITGLCISGARSLYAGNDTAIGTYPLIHALKYELRKIKVVVK